MDNEQLRIFVATLDLPGWTHTLEGRSIRVQLRHPPMDNRGSGQLLAWFGDVVYVPDTWECDRITRRVFVTQQFLLDHWHREEFTVDGERPFEAHDPPVTGYQKEWFVEHESALRGY